MNDRVMRLENSHRTFRVTMGDVARAYQAAHATDRDGCFSLKSEFDSVASVSSISAAIRTSASWSPRSSRWRRR